MCFVGIILALGVGAPALRLRGLYLTVTTLALAVAASSYLLRLEVFRSSSLDTSVISPGQLGPFDFDSYRVGYYLCLAVLVAVVLLAHRLRTGGVGRKIGRAAGRDRVCQYV